MDINKKNRTELKSFFQANDIPTQQQFEQFIDAGINQAEDGILKIQGSAIALEAEGETTGTQEILNLFSGFDQDNPDWSLNLNPRVDPQASDSNQPGLNIKDATGQSRLFIRSGNGRIGIGTIEPEARLTVRGTGNDPLIAAIDNTQQHSRIFEVSQDGGDGMLSLRGGDTTLGTRLSGAIGKPSFFLGKVGIGTNSPEVPLQVSGEDVALKITNTKSGGKSSLILNHGTAANKQWGITMQESSGDLDFIPVANENNKLIMKNDGRLETPGGVSVGVGNRANHLNADGALYRQNGQVYLTVDDHFYIRDTEHGSKMHFETTNGRIAVGDVNPAAPLSVSGSGKDGYPDTSLHISNDVILFGGNNAGKQKDSAQISAGKHAANSLNIVGMASGTDSSDRKIDLWAEGGMAVRGRIRTKIDYTVAFSVSISAGGLTGTHNPLPFGQINYNYGNSFINNNHFIAPVTGLYVFSMTISKFGGGGAYVFWQLVLNDTGYVNGFAGSETDQRSLVRATTDNHAASRTVLTKLNAGDKVHIRKTGSGHPDTHSSGFEGVLLQEFF